MPPKKPCGRLGQPDGRILAESPSDYRRDIRAETPIGFSIAVALANMPEFRGQSLEGL